MLHRAKDEIQSHNFNNEMRDSKIGSNELKIRADLTKCLKNMIEMQTQRSSFFNRISILDETLQLLTEGPRLFLFMFG